MNAKSMLSIAIALIGVLVLSDSMYTVSEKEKVIVLQFGKIVRSDVETGLHFKLPFVQDVRRYDARLRMFDTSPKIIQTKEKHFLDVDFYSSWKIADVEQYYISTGGFSSKAESLLGSQLEKGLRAQLGGRTMLEIITEDRIEVMEQLAAKINEQATIQLGIKIRDIRIKRIDLPSTVSEAVYQAMRTEREKLANEYRSTGNREKVTIEAKANKQKEILIAQAHGDSERLRGEGDAKAAAIYAKAYRADAEFYAFYRSINAYKKTFNSKSDVILVGPDSDFFRYLNNPLGVNK